LEDIRRRGELVILTRNAPTIYYEGREGLEGPEHDLATSFAEFLGVKPRFEVYYSVAEILTAMRAGKGHLAAAALTRTELREDKFLFGPDYQTVRQQLVCHRDGLVPKSVSELSRLRLSVIRASSYEENLQRLRKDFPKLSWTSTVELDTEQLLEQVWKREIDCTIADSNIVAVNRRYYPELKVAFPITEEESLAWVIAKPFKALLPALQTWLKGLQERGDLETLEERYYGHIDVFDYVDIRTFLRHTKKRLPSLLPLFQKAAAKHDFPWTLLAAMAYQESHWNPNAKSPTGVRGIMMLTRVTAKEVGVSNRLSSVQSVRGGSLYLQQMRERMPSSVQGDDRIWFALAAYNVGMGHLYDARKLARQLGKNPDLWVELKEVLPLLARRQYYRKLKHGYARGSEPVRYVQRIRDFQDVLEQQLAQEMNGTADKVASSTPGVQR
jgi:membrane-bound lytic murein transglycosylase F